MFEDIAEGFVDSAEFRRVTDPFAVGRVTDDDPAIGRGFEAIDLLLTENDTILDTAETGIIDGLL
jgi:hypothetical protein